MEELSAGATPAPYINPMRAKELVRQQQPYEGQMGQLRTPCAWPMDSLTQGYHRKNAPAASSLGPYKKKQASRVHHTRCSCTWLLSFLAEPTLAFPAENIRWPARL